MVVISDLVEGCPSHREGASPGDNHVGGPQIPAQGAKTSQARPADLHDRSEIPVVGGYLERLPLACVRSGLVDHAEVWHHSRAIENRRDQHDSPYFVRRVFRVDDETPPFSSRAMLEHIQVFGAPDILCVLGLGVCEDILKACERSTKIYNSIDAPSLRVPFEVSRHFDLVLTGADWQSAEVEARHPGMACAVMPIGPEFADATTFRPLGTEKPYDVIYVAAAQPYKRHDILFDAIASAPRRLRALCVFGYGEMGDALREEAAARGLDIDFVGPPGVSFAEVNALMNQARIGVVCGVDDGAPAILTEYMLAGLPVLANERLACGLQFITSQTGRTAAEGSFGSVLSEMLDDPSRFSPREAVLDQWAWHHSVARFAARLRETKSMVQRSCVASDIPNSM